MRCQINRHQYSTRNKIEKGSLANCRAGSRFNYFPHKNKDHGREYLKNFLLNLKKYGILCKTFSEIKG